MTTKRELMIDYIRNNAGCTSNAIADSLGFERKNVAAAMVGMRNAGIIVSDKVSTTLSNAPIYGHTLVHDVKPRSKTTVATRKISKPTSESALVSVDVLVSQLADKLLDQIVAQIKTRLTTELPLRLAEELSNLPSLIEPPKADVVVLAPTEKPVTHVSHKLARIGVVGLLAQQQQMIAQEFKDEFYIDFWNDRTGSNRATLKSLALKCEVIFVHVEHCAHNVTETLKGAGGNVRLVKGGMTSMRDALTAYYVKEAA